MTTFDKREQGFENKFAHDEATLFKATARRNKLLGAWAAEKLGLSGDAAATYAKNVVIADLEEVGDHDVVRKIVADFAAGKVSVSEQEIRATMDQLMKTALEQAKAS